MSTAPVFKTSDLFSHLYLFLDQPSRGCVASCSRETNQRIKEEFLFQSVDNIGSMSLEWRNKFFPNLEAWKKLTPVQQKEKLSQKVEKIWELLRYSRGYLSQKNRELLRQPLKPFHSEAPLQIDLMANEISEDVAKTLIDFFEAFVLHHEGANAADITIAEARTFLNELPLENFPLREKAAAIRTWIAEHPPIRQFSIPLFIRDPETREIIEKNPVAYFPAGIAGEEVFKRGRQVLDLPPEALSFVSQENIWSLYLYLSLLCRNRVDLIEKRYQQSNHFEKIDLIRDLALFGNLQTLKKMIQISPLDDPLFKEECNRRLLSVSELTQFPNFTEGPGFPSEWISRESRPACFHELLRVVSQETIFKMILIIIAATDNSLEQIRSLFSPPDQTWLSEELSAAINSDDLIKVIQIIAPHLSQTVIDGFCEELVINNKPLPFLKAVEDRINSTTAERLLFKNVHFTEPLFSPEVFETLTFIASKINIEEIGILSLNDLLNFPRQILEPLLIQTTQKGLAKVLARGDHRPIPPFVRHIILERADQGTIDRSLDEVERNEGIAPLFQVVKASPLAINDLMKKIHRRDLVRIIDLIPPVLEFPSVASIAARLGDFRLSWKALTKLDPTSSCKLVTVLGISALSMLQGYWFLSE